MCVGVCDCECVYVRVCVSVRVSVHTGQVAWCDQNNLARGTVVLPGFIFTAVFYGRRVVPLPAQRGSRSGGGAAQLEATLGPCEPVWSAVSPQFNLWDWEVWQGQWGGVKVKVALPPGTSPTSSVILPFQGPSGVQGRQRPSDASGWSLGLAPQWGHLGPGHL